MNKPKMKGEIKEANIVESDAEDWEIYERKWRQEISKITRNGVLHHLPDTKRALRTLLSFCKQ